MYSIYWQVDVSTNPFIKVTIDNVYYEGNWDDLVLNASFPLQAFPSMAPNPKPTATCQNSSEENVILDANGTEHESITYGGSRPPTW